ncbi:hypothetical protein BC567DRAFT_220121 [Phyllosticta citribraziliensis]
MADWVWALARHARAGHCAHILLRRSSFPFTSSQGPLPLRLFDSSACSLFSSLHFAPTLVLALTSRLTPIPVSVVFVPVHSSTRRRRVHSTYPPTRQPNKSTSIPILPPAVTLLSLSLDSIRLASPPNKDSLPFAWPTRPFLVHLRPIDDDLWTMSLLDL